jgi:hydroxymethylglutaryl-CoA lyase
MFLTECPRDAMQGWGEFIPTSQKIDYINALMEVGFDVLDCGSFVSPKAIPQMADTKDVMPEINKKEYQNFGNCCQRFWCRTSFEASKY